MNLFGNFFDLNFDGKATPFEELIGISIINQSTLGSKSHVPIPQQLGCDPRAEDLDLNELALLNEYERNEFLEDAGYEPDDFEF